jgi:hypothetical protein
VLIVLQVIVLRDYPASTIEETNVKDGAAQGNVEGVSHEGTGGKMETSDVCNLENNRLDLKWKSRFLRCIGSHSRFIGLFDILRTICFSIRYIVERAELTAP